ncbi:MAG: DNA primase [Myxococcales bacterium]|nr:DNA primase [Myxococcales bacterium]
MIAPETIAQIKERTDIVSLIGESVRLQRRGRSFVGLCPFHKEKSPSFHVHPDRGFYHCFGCNESGSAIDFVMKTSGLDFVEAVKMLADRAGIPIQETRSAADRAKKSERDELYEVMQLAATFYEQSLGLGAEGALAKSVHPLARYAVAELERRRLPSPTAHTEESRKLLDVAQAFRLGYAPPGWDGLAAFLKQQGISPIVAERAGLLVAGPRGHYDRFRNRLMFAVMDTLGRVVAFSGRALPAPKKEELSRFAPNGPSYDKGDEPAKYINSPESPIYTKGEQLFGLHQARAGIRQKGHAILVEGNFDVFSLHARGIDNAVAPLGTAFTAEQAKLLKRFAPTVVVTFDGDAAGRKATRASRVPCRTGGLDAKVAVLPNGVDPDDLVQKKGAAALLAVVKDARGMLDHLIQDALDGEGFLGASLAERVARVRAVAALLADEDDPNLRLMAKRYADQLSAKLIMGGQSPTDVTQLERMVAQAVSQAGSGRGSVGTQPEREPPLTPLDKRAREIFGAALDFPELLNDPGVIEMLGVAQGDLALAVAALRQFHPGRASFAGSIEDFLAALPRSIQKFAAGRVAAPAFEDAGTARAVLLENLKQLSNSLGRQDDARDVDALQRSPSTLDAESEERLRQVLERARRRHGID